MTNRSTKLLALLLALILVLPAGAFAAASFSDVESGAWYADAVDYVYDKGLMDGTGNGEFTPGGELTRAQLVTILWRKAGSPESEAALAYTDVEDGKWYSDAVRWAAANDITYRKGESFGPDDILDRDEAAYILWNAAKAYGMDVSVGEDTNILSYYDFDQITKEYIPAIQWACGAGVMQGTGEGMLEPKGHLTRAQAAALLQRMFMSQGRPGTALSLWTADAKAADELISYIEAVTDENSKDFIPVEDRIAVFDLDGTLFCETDPNYFDYMLLVHRVLEDEDYKDKASDYERETALKIVEQNETGKSFSGLEVDHGKCIASSFAGMTIKEFNDYIQEFKKTYLSSYEGLQFGDAFYRPMVQVVEYLQANDFTVYIVSGTDRLIVRGIISNSLLDIPNRQIIGSDEAIIASGQGVSDGLNYVFSEGEELILKGDFIIKNLKMNKVSVIMQEIGQQPVLSFGNSTGDSSMAEYVTSGNPYRSLAFMLCCDDTVRENGSTSKADKMYSLCNEFGWVPISMKCDWTTIYGGGVSHK